MRATTHRFYACVEYTPLSRAAGSTETAGAQRGPLWLLPRSTCTVHVHCSEQAWSILPPVVRGWKALRPAPLTPPDVRRLIRTFERRSVCEQSVSANWFTSSCFFVVYSGASSVYSEKEERKHRRECFFGNKIGPFCVEKGNWNWFRNSAWVKEGAIRENRTALSPCNLVILPDGHLVCE